MTVVDIHTHTYSPAAESLVRGRYTAQDLPYQRDMGEDSRATDVQQMKRIAPKFRDLEVRLADMAAMRVDVQVVIPAPGQQHYWADPQLHAAVSRAQNDDVASLIRAMPERFVGLGTLPMRDIRSAVDEAKRAVEELGMRGFQVDSHVNELELSDRSLDPLYMTLSTLGVPLFIHPLGFSEGGRLNRFFMVNAVGQPLEEVLATAHLVFGGVLDRFPDLKVCVAHGGGYFPYYIGRMDHTWEARPEVRRLIPQPPSTYLKRLWFDSCLFRSDALEYLVRLVGAGRVMLGSDYPFDMAEQDPRATVEACAGLRSDERAAILGENAQGLFRIG